MKYTPKVRQLHVLKFLHEGSTLTYNPKWRKPKIGGRLISIATLKALHRCDLIVAVLLTNDRKGPFRVKITEKGTDVLKEIGLVDDGKHHHIPNRKGLGKGRARPPRSTDGP